VSETVNSLVDRGRRSTEKINAKVNEKIAEKVSDVLGPEVDRRFAVLTDQIAELTSRVAALEGSGASPAKQVPAKKSPAKKAPAKKAPAKKAPAKKLGASDASGTGPAADPA
jgi:hypothetical protein